VGRMPFSPLHWFVALLIQAIFIFLDPVGLFVGSVIQDIEGIYALLFPATGLTEHGFLHSFAGALVIGLIVGGSSFVFHKLIRKIDFNFENPIPFDLPKYSLPICLLSALIGTFSHIFIDAFLYDDLILFYIIPIENPFLGILTWEAIYFLCIICFVIGAVILVGRYRAYFADEELK
jgi:hypothetical protein